MIARLRPAIVLAVCSAACSAVLLAATLLIGGTVGAAAQTLSYADAIDQLATACRVDLAKYCRNVQLGNGRLRACLDAHQNVASPGCQQTRAMVYASIARRAAAQRDIGKYCDADIERLCGTSHADAHLVECLLSVSPAAMSPVCNQTFTDTGWRTERAQQ
ncbi:MAG: cysteine rich repeat-containing protein [Xanthobacteraceae bacterium]